MATEMGPPPAPRRRAPEGPSGARGGEAMPPPPRPPKRRREAAAPATSSAAPGPRGASATVHVAFLVDNSGSMQIERRISHAFDAVDAFLGAMAGAGDVACSLATFDDEVEVKFRGQRAEGARALLEQVRRSNVLRGTGRYLQALLALEQLCSGAGVQVGILLSDGEPTEVIWEKRDPACIEQALKELRARLGNMLVLHCVGVGSFDTSCLRRLAVAGGGSFHHGCGAGTAEHLQGIFCRLSASVSTLRGTLMELGEEALKPLPVKLLEAPEVWKAATQGELDNISQPCWSWPCVETPGSTSGNLVPQGGGKRMFLHRQPFAQGALRYAFHFRSVQGCPTAADGNVMHLVVKESKYATGHRSPEDVRKFFLQNHRRAEELAREFNQAVRNIAERDTDDGSIREVQFVKAHVMQISDPVEDCGFRYVTAEKYIPGPYMKFNGNDGFVNHLSGGEAGQVAAAFSHFTFDHTGGEELCVDIQGVGTRWTDPQINSRARKFGVADLGEAGMRRFFQSHSCGRMCWSLQLRTVSPESLRFGEVVRPPQPCVVCLSNPRTQVCLPCRHLCLCDECARAALRLCPICRRRVEGLATLGAGTPGGPTFVRESQLARMVA